MTLLTRAILFGLLALAIAGCGPVPKAFEHQTETNELVDDRRITSAVVIAPVDGYPGLAEAVVKELERADILAATHVGASRYVRVEGDIEKGSLVWRLKDPSRHELGVATQGPPDADIAVLARGAVTPIATLLTARGAASENTGRKHVAMGTVRAPPGIEGPALRRAMADALVAVGVPVGSDNAVVTVEGEMRVLPGTANQDVVQMDWTVRDTKGASLGTVSQGSPVDRDQLKGSLGDLAKDIAGAGAPGIVEVIRRKAPEALGQR